MAHPGLAVALASFQATIQNTRNRLIAIPRAQQRALGLEARRDNHIIHVSVRRCDATPRRWNHHYFKLTGDNEFAIPTDVTSLQPGDSVEVKVHGVIPDRPLPARAESAAAMLVRLANEPSVGWREDGSDRVDEYLNADIANE